VATIKNESGSWKWAAFTIIYTTTLAWIAAFAVYNIARLII
jgi:ferrous iron transport protein B